MAQNSNKGRWSGKSENDIRTKKNKTLPILLQKFSSQLDVDIICNVAENHNWEFEPSIRDLIQLTSHTQNSHINRQPPNIPMHIPPPRPNIPIAPVFQQPNAFMSQPYFNFQPAMPLINTNRPNFNSGNDPKNAPMYKPNTRASPKQGPAKSDVVHGKQNQTYQGKNNPANHPNKSMKKLQPQENKPKTVGSKTGPQQGGAKTPFAKIRDHIKAGHRIMVLMRGCPGSGKTHTAKHLITITVKKPFSDHIFSTDDYFDRDKKNGYLFIPEQLPKAHDWNLKRVQSVTDRGISPIIVDNTNSEPWEMAPYMKLAVANGYIIELLEIRTKWHRDEVELTRRNIHGVPRHTIHNMLERFKYGLSPGKLFQQYKFSYPPGKQPPKPATNLKQPTAATSVSEEKKKDKKPRPRRNKNLAKKLINADSEDAGKILSGLDANIAERLKHYLDEIQALKLKDKNDETDATEATLEANVVAALEKKESKEAKSFTSSSSLQDPDDSDNDSSMSADGSSDRQEDDGEDLLDINNWDTESNFGADLISLDDEACSREDSWQYLLAKNIDSSSLSQSSTDLVNIEEKSSTEDWEKWFVDFSQDSEKNSQEGTKRKLSFPEQPDLLLQNSLWGVGNEEDWEIPKKEILSPFSLEPQDQRLPQKNTCDVEVNTNESDCYLSNRLDSGLIPEGELKNVGKILNAYHRDIISPSLNINPAPRRTGYFDKSSMTEKIINDLQGDAGAIELMHMFPSVPRVEIDDLLERCDGDLDWAAKLLLETNTTERISESSILENPIDIPFEKEDSTPRPEIESMPKHRSFRQKKSIPPSEESIILKKELETNFNLNESLYSLGTRKARRLKQGRSLDNDEPSLSISEQIPAASTSSITHLLDEDIPDETVEEEEKYIPIKLDSAFVRESQNNFGISIYPITDSAPEIEIPMSLARQLHYYLMEHLQKKWNKQQNALDSMIQEDEAIARLLQEAENENKEAPNMREIMDMEMALAIYKADQEAECGASNKEDLATLLQKRMLKESFPMVDPKLLNEILKAHNNNLRDTIMVIEENLDLTDSPAKHVMSPEALALQEKSLIERAKQESLKLVPEKKPTIVVRPLTELSLENNEQSVESFRKEAANFYDRRNEYSAKARDAFRANQYSTASYYSTMVEIYRKKIEQVNNQAASSLVALQKPDVTTLDLHHLFVREAIEVLDCFIDRHLQRLKDLNGTSLANKNKIRETIYLITGRGANSRDGKSRIRPAVMSRLQQRKLKFTTENPGMLKVILHKDNKLTKEFNE